MDVDERNRRLKLHVYTHTHARIRAHTLHTDVNEMPSNIMTQRIDVSKQRNIYNNNHNIIYKKKSVHTADTHTHCLVARRKRKKECIYILAKRGEKSDYTLHVCRSLVVHIPFECAPSQEKKQNALTHTSARAPARWRSGDGWRWL